MLNFFRKKILSTMAYSSSSNKLMFFFSASLLLFLFSTNFVAGESDKVKLNLYYESLCPYCHKFITNDLVKFFKSDLHRIADLKLVPFGNAKVSDNLTVTCQVLFKFSFSLLKGDSFILVYHFSQ